MAVRSVLEKLNIDYSSIELGRVDLKEQLTLEQYQAVDAGLKYYELELLDNNRVILVERVKNIITEMVYASESAPILKFTAYLSQQLNYDYTYLSNIFSEVEGSTIEKFFIHTRVRRVKELMLFDNKNLKEICYELNYSSVAHLCFQFKKVTGLRPSEFRKMAYPSSPTQESVNNVV